MTKCEKPKIFTIFSLKKSLSISVQDMMMNKRNTVFQLSKYCNGSRACNPLWLENKVNLYSLPFLSLYCGDRKITWFIGND